MTGRRRQAREIALKVLFLIDANPELSADAALALYFQHFHRAGRDDDPPDGEGDGERADLDSVSPELTDAIVRGVASRLPEIDETITRVSKNWRVERMAQVDRNVIRMALWELQSCDDIPKAVTLDEAIELARRYGSAEAGAFVNGLLDRAIEELGIKK